jgi:hypothetical protein
MGNRPLGIAVKNMLIRYHTTTSGGGMCGAFIAFILQNSKNFLRHHTL